MPLFPPPQKKYFLKGFCVIWWIGEDYIFVKNSFIAGGPTSSEKIKYWIFNEFDAD